MNTPDTEWSEQIIDLGVQVNTVQDGDANYREYTFNDAQLEAFTSSRDTYWKERVRKEVEGMRKTKTFPQHLNGWDGKTTYFERLSDGDIHFNQALDTLLDNLK